MKDTITAIKTRFNELFPRRDSRGQLTIIGIVMTAITLIVYVGIRPVIMSVLSDAGLTGTEKLIADLIPLVILVMILLSALHYGTPQRQY